MQPFRKVIGSEVKFTIPPDSQCPCKSTKPAYRCCLTEYGFVKQPRNTRPRGNITNFCRDRCYANTLNDCSKQLSREHYVSRNLLEYLNKDKDLRIEGTPWSKDTFKIVSPDALSSNILCGRHNNILSEVDQISLKLFKALDESKISSRPANELCLFSGHDLERWLLKVLCGLIVSKSLILTDGVEGIIQKEWISILFGYSDFSDDQGLYVCRDRGHEFSGITGLEARAIVRNNLVSGLGLKICGYELVLSMSGFPSRTFDGRNFAYRPLEFYVTNGKYEKSVLFSWLGIADLGTISLNLNEI